MVPMFVVGYELATTPASVQRATPKRERRNCAVERVEDFRGRTHFYTV